LQLRYICRALSTDLRHRPIALRHRRTHSTERSALSTSLTVGSLFNVARKNNVYLNFLHGV